MKTQFRCSIQYADVDSSMHIRLANLLNYLLLASDDSVRKTGVSTAFLRDQYASAWVLSQLNLMLYELPLYGEDIQIETWVEKKGRQLIFRHYTLRRITAESVEEIGIGSSVWTIIGLTTRQVTYAVFADEALWTPCYAAGGHRLTRLSRRGIADSLPAQKRQVRYSDVDFNDHLNSCKYISFIMDAYPHLRAQVPLRMDIKYSKEIRLGEEVSIRMSYHDTKIADNAHEPNRVAEFELRNQEGDLACSAIVMH